MAYDIHSTTINNKKSKERLCHMFWTNLNSVFCRAKQETVNWILAMIYGSDVMNSGY